MVGPVRRGRGRRLRVERRVLPVTADEERRAQVFERELWRIAVEHLTWGEQHAWAALAGARVASNNWRRAKAMLHFDYTGELRRRFLITCLQRNRNTQLRVRALSEVGALRDPEAFDEAVEIVGGWSRDERREGVKVLLQALAERPIGRRDQASRWLWHLAEYSREVHEEYAVSRWPETKRLLGLLVNSSGGAHARNARRLVQATKKQDRRLSAALLAAALAHTPEAQQVLDGARMRMARKPSALARELLRNFPKGRRRRGGRRRARPRSARTAGPAEQSGAVSGRRPGAEPQSATTRGRASRRRPRRRGAAPTARSSVVSRQSSVPGGPRRRPGPRGPASVSTSSAPDSSTPAAVPAPPSQRDGLPLQRVARAPRRQHLARAPPSHAPRAASSAASTASTDGRAGVGQSQRGGRVRQLGRELRRRARSARCPARPSPPAGGPPPGSPPPCGRRSRRRSAT